MASGTQKISHNYNSSGNWKWITFDNGVLIAWGQATVSATIDNGPYNKSGFYYSDVVSIPLPFSVSSGYGTLCANNLTTATNLGITDSTHLGARLLGGAKITSQQSYVLNIIFCGMV